MGRFIRIQNVLILALGFCFSNVETSSAKDPNLDQMLRDGSLGSQFSLESELVRKYGPGLVEKPYEDVRWHTYFLPGDGLWLRCKIEANKTVSQPLTEILISRLPLAAQKIHPKAHIGALELRGSRIGDGIDAMRKRWGTPFRSEDVSLNGIGTVSYRYFPSEFDRGTCLSFYVRDGSIVAFSVSNPE